MNKVFLFITALTMSGLLGFSFSWYLHRIKQPNDIDSLDIPITQTFHTPYSFAKQLKGDPDAGRKIFKEFCAACHAANPTIDIHAPTLDDKKVWKGLSQLGMKQLLHLTIKGVKAMPARGGCFECSDQQLQQTIEYMLRESSQ